MTCGQLPHARQFKNSWSLKRGKMNTFYYEKIHYWYSISYGGRIPHVTGSTTATVTRASFQFQNLIILPFYEYR